MIVIKGLFYCSLRVINGVNFCLFAFVESLITNSKDAWHDWRLESEWDEGRQQHASNRCKQSIETSKVTKEVKETICLTGPHLQVWTQPEIDTKIFEFRAWFFRRRVSIPGAELRLSWRDRIESFLFWLAILYVARLILYKILLDLNFEKMIWVFANLHLDKLCFSLEEVVLFITVL